MKIRALLVILLTLACAGAYAQDGGVKGKVVSRDGRVALSNVKVVVEPLGVTVMTDNHGNFNIDQLPKGEYQLKFEAPEFENLDLAIRVDKMVKNLNSVVMAPDVQYVIDDAVFAEFDSDTAADGQSLPSSLSSSKDVFNNIASYKFSEMRFNVRGYDSQYSSIYLNGIRFNDAMTGYGPWSLWSGLNDATRNQENTAGLRSSGYGIDGIELRDRKNQTLWSDHYTMENPQMISCGDAIAIYDKNGTKIVVYDADGKAGEITASYPIVKASVAGQGVVAAILENNGESWIKYYNTDGTEIASSHPNMDSPGYPMDLSLSSDGLWMAVSYAYEDGGKMKSQVAFYNFGSRGEDLVDNLASSSSYTDMLCPQIETAGTSSWVAFFDNGFRIYEGTNKPKETVSVSEDGEILSCAYADDRVVLILRGESDDHPYRMKIYNLKGKQLADENLDFYYQNLQIEEKQILLTNRQELCVYTLNGRKKYSGVVSETQIHEILGMGQNRYLLAEEDGVSMIRLK